MVVKMAHIASSTYEEYVYIAYRIAQPHVYEMRNDNCAWVPVSLIETLHASALLYCPIIMVGIPDAQNLDKNRSLAAMAMLDV